jgi:hypothetical protein
MDPLCSTDRIPVKEKKEAAFILLFKNYKRINKNQGRKISDPTGDSEQFYFCQVMH